MNAQETPTTVPPTLYPFRLEEAKQNLGNVVTRDGKTAEYIGDSGAVQWPHSFKVSGVIRSYRYTDKGRFYNDHDEDCDDLFMTTPEDKPATFTLPELLLLTNGHPPHREDGWTREMLEEGWRPLLRDERLQNGDSVWIHSIISEFSDGKPYWKVWENGERPHHGNATFYRTRRPAPPKSEEDADQAVGKTVPLFEHIALQRGCDRLQKSLTTAEQEISRLTRERDDAREAASKSADSCLGLIGERDDAYSQRDKAIDNQNGFYTFMKRAQSRAESAEAQLATLRGELAVALVDQELLKGLQNDIASYSQQTADAISSMVEHRKEIDRLQKQLAAHTWTPTSERMPTEADGLDGLVWVWRAGAQVGDMSVIHYKNVTTTANWYTHWMTPIPLPPSEQTEEDTAFEKWEQEQGDGIFMGDKRALVKAAFLAGQAARKGGGK